MEPINPDNELDRQLVQLFELAQRIRAPFLELAISIEKVIEDIIAQHFCPEENRRILFFSLVINGTDLTFSSKIRILERLLELCYPDIIKKYPKLIDEIQKVRRFRNRIAHAMLDSTETFLSQKHTDRIQLTYHEDGQTKHQIITIPEKNVRLKEGLKVLMALNEIQEEVIKRVSSTTK
jgi:hypothetical protein